MFDILQRTVHVKREKFDPTNQAHLDSLAAYLRTGNWGDIQFYPELPFIEVPITVLTKFAMHHLKAKPESAIERDARLSTKNLVQPQRPMTGAQARASNEAHLVEANRLLMAQRGAQ